MLILLTTLLAASPAVAPGPAGFPEELSRPLLASVRSGKAVKGLPAWTWPAAPSFQGAWKDAEGQLRPYRVVRGLLETTAGRKVRGDWLRQGDALIPLAVEAKEQSDDLSEQRWTVTPALASNESKLNLSAPGRADQATLAVEEVLTQEPIPAAERVSWVYVATLLETPAPLYAPGEFAREEAALQKAVGAARSEAEGIALLRSPTEVQLSGRVWSEVAAAAEQRGQLELALEIYRRYRPVGGCSMDTRPAEVAREYAELCYRHGQLGCFLQLQILIMGDQFERLASSSYGEAAHGTEAERLLETGIDVDRFLLGLVLQFEGARPRAQELWPWRLSRAILEAGREATMVPALKKLAADPGLDEFNRYRATRTLVHLWLRQHVQKEEIAARLKDAGLGRVSTLWWSGCLVQNRC